MLISPEHFAYWETLAVPQLTGYLEQRGYPVVQRSLDLEFLQYLASSDALDEAFHRIESVLPVAPDGLLFHLNRSLNKANLDLLEDARYRDVRNRLEALCENWQDVARVISASGESLLRQWFLLDSDAVMTGLARLELVSSLWFAPTWPQRYDFADGIVPGYTSSAQIGRFAGDEDRNALIGYYRERIIPTLPDNPMYVGLSASHPSQLMPAATLARLIRIHRPGTHIVLGGAHLTLIRDALGSSSALWDYFDSVGSGPGEETLEALYDELSATAPSLAAVPNLSWKGRDGVVRTVAKKSSFSLQNAATPRFTDTRPSPILPIRTSSGCDWGRCVFCHFPDTDVDGRERGYVTRPIEKVWADIETLEERHAPAGFWICDSNVSGQRLEEFVDTVRVGVPRRIFAFARAVKPLVDPVFCERLRSAGFVGLQIGIESGSQALLDRVHKGILVSDIGTILKNCDRAGIWVGGFLMTGLPTETQQDREATVAFLGDHLRYLQGALLFSEFELKKRSPLANCPEAYGIRSTGALIDDLGVSLGFSYSDPPAAEVPRPGSDSTDNSASGRLAEAIGITREMKRNMTFERTLIQLLGSDGR